MGDFAPAGRQDYFGTPPAAKRPNSLLNTLAERLPGLGAKAAATEELGRAARPLLLFDPRTGGTVTCPAWLLNTETAGRAKEVAADLLRIPAAQLQLSWNGTVLEDNRTLVSYRIHGGQCLHATWVDRQRSIQVEAVLGDDPSRPPLLAQAWSSETVLQLKRRLSAQTGVPIGEQRLVHHGRAMVNESRLADYCPQGGALLVHLHRPARLSAAAPSEAAAGQLAELDGSAATAAAAGDGRAPGRPGVELAARTPGGRRAAAVELEPREAVMSLKRQVAQASGLEPARQLLFYRGRTLDDWHTASFYNMRSGDGIDVLQRGGAAPQPAARDALGGGAASQSPRGAALRGLLRGGSAPQCPRGGAARGVPDGGSAPQSPKAPGKRRASVQREQPLQSATAAAEELLRHLRQQAPQAPQAPQNMQHMARHLRQQRLLMSQLLSFPEDLTIPLGSRARAPSARARAPSAPPPCDAVTAPDAAPLSAREPWSRPPASGVPAAALPSALAAEKAIAFVRGVTERALDTREVATRRRVLL